jgi:hypothetical protein
MQNIFEYNILLIYFALWKKKKQDPVIVEVNFLVIVIIQYYAIIADFKDIAETAKKLNVMDAKILNVKMVICVKDA